MNDIQHYMRPGTLQLKSLPPLSLYVHLPWCIKKCPYCDFNSHEVASVMPEQAYIHALVAMGQLDLVVEWGLKPYDIQALIPIVQAARRERSSCENAPLPVRLPGR